MTKSNKNMAPAPLSALGEAKAEASVSHGLLNNHR